MRGCFFFAPVPFSAISGQLVIFVWCSGGGPQRPHWERSPKFSPKSWAAQHANSGGWKRDLNGPKRPNCQSFCRRHHFSIHSESDVLRPPAQKMSPTVIHPKSDPKFWVSPGKWSIVWLIMPPESRDYYPKDLETSISRWHELWVFAVFGL